MVKSTQTDLPEKETHHPNTDFEYHPTHHAGQAAMALRMPSQPLKIEGKSKVNVKKESQDITRLSGMLISNLHSTAAVSHDNLQDDNKTVIQIEKTSNEGDCFVKEVHCLKYNFFNIILGVLASLCTGFVFLIFVSKFQQLFKYFFYTHCTIDDASHFLTLNFEGEWLLQKKKSVTDLRGQKKIGFVNRYMTYLYSTTSSKFRTLDLEIDRLLNNEILMLQPLDELEIQKRRSLFGKCIIQFSLQGFGGFIYDFVASPFFVIWLTSMIIWVLQTIYFFAGIVFAETFICVVILYILSRRSKQQILDRAKKVVPVYRNKADGTIEKIQSDQLVPGDFIRLEPKAHIPCDVILMQGESFVNESNITGESDPVPKVKLEDNDLKFSYYNNSSSVIYEGSQILNSVCNNANTSVYNLANASAQDYAVGIVIRTGFSSKKGQVIRKSIFPKVDLQQFLYTQTKFCVFWILLSFVSFAIQAYWIFSDDEIPEKHKWLKLFEGFIDFGAAFLIILNSVSLIAGTYRLQRKSIQAVNYNLVANAGEVQLICFDKTGTLTENQVYAKGFWSENSQFISAQEIKNKTANGQHPYSKDQLLQKLFATCHSSQPNRQKPGEVLGDIVDVQAFQLSDYDFGQAASVDGKQALMTAVPNNASENLNKLHVIKRYDFKSEHASMSVIVKEQDKTFVFVKGSPEKIKSLCLPQYLPDNFDQINNEYSIQGLRVLALAYRPIDIKKEGHTLEKIHREDVDKNLQFLGFLVLDNPLKKDSREVMDRFGEAEIPIKIISGDNNLTVAHTAVELGLFNENQCIYHIDLNEKQQCLTFQVQKGKTLIQKNNIQTEQEVKKYLRKLLSHTSNQISIKGKAVEYIRQFRVIQKQNKAQDAQIDKNVEDWANMYRELVLKTKVLSRCTPQLKQAVVEELKSQNIWTAMVGDGANDCLAIVEANIGISFATADAALSSDFCTDNLSIDCVEKVILEGRNTMGINYEISHIYLLVVYMRYVMHMFEIYYYQIPNSLQNILPGYFGGYLCTTMFWNLSEPVNHINKYKVSNLMTSARCIVSTCGRWGAVLITLFIFNFDMKDQGWYETPTTDEDGAVKLEGQINTVFFYLTCFWTAAVPFVLYISYPAKKSLWRNFLTFLVMISNIVLAGFLFFIDEDHFGGLNLVPIPDSYRASAFAAAMGCFAFMIFWEKIVVDKFFLYDQNKVIRQSPGAPYEDSEIKQFINKN